MFHLSATRATPPRTYGARSSACPRNVASTSAALPSVSSSGGTPLTVCVMPAPPVICSTTRPVASLTSAHDVPLNVRTSGTSAAMPLVALAFEAGVAADLSGVVVGVAGAGVVATLAGAAPASFGSVGDAGAASETGFGNAVVTVPGAAAG